MGGVTLCITIVMLVIIMLCCKWKKKREIYHLKHGENVKENSSANQQNDTFVKLVDLHC